MFVFQMPDTFQEDLLSPKHHPDPQNIDSSLERNEDRAWNDPVWKNSEHHQRL